MDITLKKFKGTLFFKKISSKEQIEEDLDGFLIDSDEKNIRRILDVLKAKNIKKKIAVLGRDNEFNRRMLETCKIDFLVSPERKHEKDGLKQRDSGLNHVLAKIAAKKGIVIIIDISQIREKEGKEKVMVISRIIQNIKICRKAKCKIKIASFSETEKDLIDNYGLRAIGFSLGMSSQQVKSIEN